MEAVSPKPVDDVAEGTDETWCWDERKTDMDYHYRYHNQSYHSNRKISTSHTVFEFIFTATF